MAITPDTLIRDVQARLQDASGVVWAEADMFDYFNNALYVLMLARPHAFSAISSLLLTADANQQSITNAYMILDIIRNMGSDGSTPGKPISEIDRWQMDTISRAWYSQIGKTYVEHYMYEPEKSLSSFHVYPKTHATTPVYVEANLATYPTKVARTFVNTASVDVPTDVFTTDLPHGLVVDDRVSFSNVVSLPAPLIEDTDYYVNSVPLTTTFTLSTEPFGVGSFIDILDTGGPGGPNPSVYVTNKYDAISLDQSFEPFLKEWMMYEAFNKETTPDSRSEAARHMQVAAQLIGLKVQALQQAKALAEKND